ncbi:deoxyribonuclease IV [bacterium]|nr:deoxyribonuclease IV [bacterium]
MPLFGAHVSIAGGLANAIERGEELGCEAIQIFSRNQRQWRSPPISGEEAGRFLERLTDSGIEQVIIHDSYLINLAQPDRDKREQSIESFAEEMRRADLLRASALVFHPGSHMGEGYEAGISTAAASLNRLLDADQDGRVTLAAEITAGQGTNIGYRLEQLAALLDLVEHRERMGVCFDTAHAFAAGYDITGEEGYRETFAALEGTIGLDKLAVFHLNDSKTPAGGRVDRHDNLGSGLMGETPFRRLVRDARFKGLPMILETPGGEVMFRKNLDLLRRFRGE